jgi:hypothetical protein
MILLPLTRGKEVQIDESDLSIIEHFSWYAFETNGRWYAATTVNGSTVKLSTMLMNPEPGKVVMHWNGDSLDCRRCNLRAVSHRTRAMYQKMNRHNTSGYRGVVRVGKKWKAQITVRDGERKRTVYLGIYSTPEEASAEYWYYAHLHFGDE